MFLINLREVLEKRPAKYAIERSRYLRVPRCGVLGNAGALSTAALAEIVTAMGEGPSLSDGVKRLRLVAVFAEVLGTKVQTCPRTSPEVHSAQKVMNVR